MKYSYCYVDSYNLTNLLCKKTDYWVLDIKDFDSENLKNLLQKLKLKKIDYGFLSTPKLTGQIINFLKPKNVFFKSKDDCSLELVFECIKNNCLPLFLNEEVYALYKSYCMNSSYVGSFEDLLLNSSEILSKDVKNQVPFKEDFLRKEILSNCFYWGIGNEISKESINEKSLWYIIYQFCVNFLKNSSNSTLSLKNETNVPDFFYLFPIKDFFVVERKIARDTSNIEYEEDGNFHIYFRQQEREDNLNPTPRILPPEGILILSKIRDTNPYCFLSESEITNYVQKLMFNLLGENSKFLSTHNGHDLFYKDKKFYSSEIFRDASVIGGTLVFTILYINFSEIKSNFIKYCSDSKNSHCGIDEFLPSVKKEKIINYIISDMVKRNY